VIGVIIIAVLAVFFVALIWVRSGGPDDEVASLGDNLPYPETVFWALVVRPRPGTPESLESHEGRTGSTRNWNASGPGPHRPDLSFAGEGRPAARRRRT